MYSEQLFVELFVGQPTINYGAFFQLVVGWRWRWRPIAAGSFFPMVRFCQVKVAFGFTRLSVCYYFAMNAAMDAVDGESLVPDSADESPRIGDEPYFGSMFDEQLKDCPVVDPSKIVIDDDTVGAIVAIAKGMGCPGDSVEDICLTWMRPIADCGWGVAARGLARAKSALKLVGLILDGTNPTKALVEVGLTRKELAAFRAASPEFAKVYRAAIRARREAIGDDVLETAYEMATVGDEVTVRDRNGNVVGTDIIRNERLVDRLLSLSAPEFQRGSAQAMLDIKGSTGGDGPAVVMNFHFDRNGYPGTGNAVENSKGSEVVDV